jgi:carboxypeptidase Q
MARFNSARTLICLCLVIAAGCQPTPRTVAVPKLISTPVDPVISKIRDEGLKHSHVDQTLDYLCNVIGQRLTGSPSQSRASDWTRDTLEKWGLTDAHLEGWGPFGRGWSVDRFSIQIIDPYTIVLTGYPKAWSPGFDEPVDLDVVYLNAKKQSDLTKYSGKLKGKAVLIGVPRAIDAHFAAESQRLTTDQLAKLSAAPLGKTKAELLQATTAATAPTESKTTQPSVFAQTASLNFMTEEFSFAAKEGAALVIDPSIKGDGGIVFVTSASVPGPTSRPTTRRSFRPGPSTRPKPYAVDAPTIPAQITITAENFNRLVRMLANGQPLKLAVDLRVRFYPPAEVRTFNTIAEIPGSDLKDQIVMIGGHLDSWHSGTGATDNAVGAACAMEAVRIIRALDLHPRRTIRIGLWTGEEEGLLGSTAYVKAHFGAFPEDPASSTTLPFTRPVAGVIKKPEYEQLSVYFNLDNGTGKIRGIYAQSNPAAIPYFTRWLQPFADLDASTVTITNTGSTDHIPFDRIGLPGFQFIQDPIEYFPRTHHSNADVFDRIQMDDMRQASTIMAAFLWDAANMDERFPRKSTQ